MTSAIEALYIGGKRIELTHQLSGTKIITDAPPDNNGEGTSFSPTDLVAGALASCALTVMAIVAERNGYDLSGARASSGKIMSTTPRRIAKLPVVFHLPQSLSPEARDKLERSAYQCPVHHSLLAEIEITFSFLYDQ
jgi:putative redox protein